MNSLFVAISVGILAQAPYEPTIDLPIPPLPTAEVSTRPLGQPAARNGTPVSEGCFAAPEECWNNATDGHPSCSNPFGLVCYQGLTPGMTGRC